MIAECMTTRRTILKIAGGAGVALPGAAVWRAWDQGVFSSGEGPAYEAWKTWNSDAPSPVHRLVRAAILAANPHNTQLPRPLLGVSANRTKTLESSIFVCRNGRAARERLALKLRQRESYMSKRLNIGQNDDWASTRTARPLCGSRFVPAMSHGADALPGSRSRPRRRCQWP